MNRDHDHDIADLLIRERNAQHNTPCKAPGCWCRSEHSRVHAVISMLEQDAPREEVEEFCHIKTCRHALWVAENEGQIDGEDYTRAHLWLDSMQRQLTEADNADIHGDGVPEDRHSELLRIGQGDMDRQDQLDYEREWFSGITGSAG